MTPSPRGNRALIVVLYVNAVLLAAGVIALLSRPSMPSVLPAAYAQNQAPIGGGAGVFVMPAQFADKLWGCYLLDVDSQTLCAYTFQGNEKTLRLIAARNFRNDRHLGNFNTDPDPRVVGNMLDKEKASRGPDQNNNVPASPETPKQD
jgi:hypothetical protein